MHFLVEVPSWVKDGYEILTVDSVLLTCDSWGSAMGVATAPCDAME